MVTWPTCTVSPGCVYSQLPPPSAARSMITRAGLHAVDLRLADQLRRRPARNRGGGDDDVGRLDVLGDDRGDLVLLFLRQLARVAALRRAHRRRCRRTWRRAIRPAPWSRAARRSLRHARRGGARWRSPAGRRRPTPITSAVPGGSSRRRRSSSAACAPMRGRAEQRAVVAGQRGLRGQRVHRLRARDARHQFHREAGDLAVAQQLDQLDFLVRVDEATSGSRLPSSRRRLPATAAARASDDVGVATPGPADWRRSVTFLNAASASFTASARAGLHVDLGAELGQLVGDGGDHAPRASRAAAVSLSTAIFTAILN